jgi:AraC family transcriptional regulator
LIDIQQNLDTDLNLDQLSASYGYSPYHFHRIFTDLVGETPKKYVQRLRMEKAAYKLWITGNTVIDVGFSVGFSNHETFTRAFRRFFGVSPRQFRADGLIRRSEHLQAQKSWRPDDCFLSPVRFESLRPMSLLSIRHLGDYLEIPEAFSAGDNLWNPLIEWAERNRIAYQPIALAIFYDNPWLTPKNAQRTDVCIPVTSPVGEVDATPADIRTPRYIRFEGGTFGIIEHIGPYPTLRNAFRRLADTIHESDQYRPPEEPAGAICVKTRAGNGAGRSEVWMRVVKSPKTTND